MMNVIDVIGQAIGLEIVLMIDIMVTEGLVAVVITDHLLPEDDGGKYDLCSPLFFLFVFVNF